MFDLFSKKKTQQAVKAVNNTALEEFQALIRVLKNSNETYQFAAGNGFNLANTEFRKEFGGRESFLKLSLEERVKVLERFRKWAEAVNSKDKGAGSGIFVFSRALAYVAFEDHASEQALKGDFDWLSQQGGGGGFRI